MTESQIEKTMRLVIRREGLTLKQRLWVVPYSWWTARPSGWELRHPRTTVAADRLCRELRFNFYTMLEVRRGRTLMALARSADRRGVPGAVVDCGVWNGGSSVLMSTGAPSRDVWLFDSFEGMPQPTENDGAGARQWVGDARGSIERVQECFARYGRGAPLHIVKGWFEETLPHHRSEIGPIALLHVDADFYEGMRLALETLYPLVSPGGFIAIDDYGHRGFPGVKIAVDEFRARIGELGPLVDNHFWEKSL